MRRLPLALAFAALAACGGPALGEEAKAPKPTRISYYYDAVDQSLIRPWTRWLDAGRLAHGLAAPRVEAANVDEDDRVRLPSRWWQPRLGSRDVSVEQMLEGPGPGTGPVMQKKWRVKGIKTQGVSPGIRVKDAGGHTYQLKFDPPAWPEMSTGADAVVSRLFWAAGYNVPDNTVVIFDRDQLEIDEKATYTDTWGREHRITPAVLDTLLTRVARAPDGRLRAVASRFLDGKPLGEWEYRDRRKDDPEDLIPHQHRREVRGLFSIAAWTNHTDGSARNTLDMWVTEGGRSFVRHYLLDFSGCLGSGSINRQNYSAGNEYFVDFGTALQQLFTLGLNRFAWERTVDPHLAAVGFFESSAFDPDGWKPFLPNPAYDERTRRDVRWGARIVAAFTDEHIRAAVARGHYSDPAVEEYIARTLIERRDKIVREVLRGEASARATR